MIISIELSLRITNLSTIRSKNDKIIPLLVLNKVIYG